MSRIVLTALTAITAVLGVVMENTWLLLAAGAFFVLALAVLGVLAFRRHSRRRERAAAQAQRTREDELRELGISEIRPKTTRSRTRPESQPESFEAASTESATTAIEPEEPPAVADEPVEELAGGAAASPEAGPLPSREPETASDDSTSMLQSSEDHPLWQAHSPTAFASFLRACWAATEAQTALVATPEQDGTFALLAIRSHLPAARNEGRLPADSFLHVADADRPLTVLEANDPLVRDLPYYKGQVNVGGVAILPVKTGEHTAFLAADLRPDQPGFTSRQKALLLGFAELLRTLLEHPLEEPAAQGVPTRRAVIAEEMQHAHTEDRPLALALVYRADAERVAARGASAVAEAERELRLLLEDLVHHGRLERFGELMFGAFLYDDKHFIEEWADRVQERAVEEDFNVGIGVARMGSHKDADELRADAANALAEALAAGSHVAFARPRLR